MKNITIETMQDVHIPGVLEIENEVFRSPWTAEMFAQELVDRGLSLAYVAMESGSLVGYMISWLLRREVHLINIAVHPGRQRQGIGTRMLDYLFDYAAGVNRRFITLEVRESNDSAIRLYESFGFKQIGLRPGYYQEDDEDAVVMVRFIPLDGSRP